MKLHAAMMTQNELHELVPNLEGLLSVADTVTVVDGGSTDGSILFLRNWARSDPKLRVFIHPWQDNFPAQRNNYLRRVGEVAAPGDWMVACDPDEYLEPEALGALRELAALCEKHGRSAVGFRCRSVSLRGRDRVWQHEDSFWKRLFIKWHTGLRYIHHGEGPVHEDIEGIGQMVNSGFEFVQRTYWYEHRKQENAIWIKGMRNLFCGGGGPNLGSTNPRWVELRKLTTSLGITTWNHMYRYMLQGDIDPRLKEWMLAYCQITGFDGASEHRECYKTYFRLLHPEEEPAELRGAHIP